MLLPPVAWSAVGEKLLKGARYRRSTKSKPENEVSSSPEAEHKFEIIEEDTDPIPFATWDPDSKDSVEEGNGTKYSKLVEPVRVTLEEGDMLYLPALWYVSSPTQHNHNLFSLFFPLDGAMEEKGKNVESYVKRCS